MFTDFSYKGQMYFIISAVLNYYVIFSIEFLLKFIFKPAEELIEPNLSFSRVLRLYTHVHIEIFKNIGKCYKKYMYAYTNVFSQNWHE